MHCLVHVALIYIFVAPYCAVHHQWSAMIWVGPIVGLLHFMIDTGKVYVEQQLRRLSRSTKLFLFLLDQLLHIVVIFGVLYLVDYLSFASAWECLIKLVQGKPVILTPAEKILAILIVVLCATVVSGVIVQIVTEPVPTNELYLVDEKVIVTETSDMGQVTQKERRTETSYARDTRQGIPRGTVIGYLERLIVVFVVCVGDYSVLGFIVAAKSLARFKKLDNQEWAEYFLVGTLCSLLCGALSGFALKLFL
jgi:hypothetical protein